VIDSEDFTDDDDDEADLLLPPKSRETSTSGTTGNSRQTWQESLNAETSPDSLASTSGGATAAGPEVKYEGFTEFNYNNKSNTMNLS
jgi:hypothetical protein